MVYYTEMVYRFEMAPQSGQRSILQYMVPWLHNIELIDHHRPQGDKTGLQDSTDHVLQGSGWGSREGTQLILHNLLYITAKVSGVFIVWVFNFVGLNVLFSYSNPLAIYVANS